MRAKRRAPCHRCRREVVGTRADRPLCRGCRRELMGFDRDKPINRRDYWREYQRRWRRGQKM